MSPAVPPGEAMAAARAALLREAGLADEAQSLALADLTRVAVEAVRASAAFVSLLGERESYFQCSTGLKPPFGSAEEGARSIVRHLLDSPTPFAASDIRTDDVLGGSWEVELLGAVALLAVPLVVDGVPLGVLAVLDPAPRDWTERETEILLDVANIATHQIALGRVAAARARRESERAERALVQSEARYRTLVENAPDPILVVRDDVIAYANPAAVELAGASSALELVGLPAERLVVPPFLKRLRVDILHGVSTPGTRVDDRLTRLDGSVRDVEVSALPYLVEDEPAILLLLRDVTERHRAEAEIRRQQAQLRLLAEQLPVLVWATDAELRLTAVQGDRTGVLPSPDRLGEPVHELLGSVDPHGIALVAQNAAVGGRAGRYRVEWRARTYDVHVEPLRREDGEVVGTVGVAMDVTEQKEVAERLKEAQHLALVGQIAGGVAHEMNNVLGTVLGLASALALSPDLPVHARSDLAILQDASRKGGEITSRLLGFARRGMYQRVRIATPPLLARVAARAAGFSTAVRVVRDWPPDVPEVEGDAAQIEAALTNLCRNAVDAMPQGGTLTLQARVERVAPGDEAPQGPPAGTWTRIHIVDTGAGMEEAVRARAVEPFFTTKPIGKGAGLGLSMAYGVVVHHDGLLVLDSAPGRGTTVTVFLPAAKAEAPAVTASDAPPEATPADPTPGTGTVLLVDDDEWVRWSSRRLLEALGYRVLDAEDGAKAVALYAEHGPEITAVLLDLRMPGMDGAEVLRRLVAMDPDARVVLCTGYERDQVSQGLFALGRVGFLGKPFTVKELTAQLAACARAPREPVHAS